MDVQTRAELGIGYYYKKDNKIVYIPIDRGQSVIEHWLKNDDSIDIWWKVGLLDGIQNNNS